MAKQKPYSTKEKQIVGMWLVLFVSQFFIIFLALFLALFGFIIVSITIIIALCIAGRKLNGPATKILQKHHNWLVTTPTPKVFKPKWDFPRKH